MVKWIICFILVLLLIINQLVMKRSLLIYVKPEGQKSTTANIDVQYDDTMAEIKMKEIGTLLKKLNPDAVIEVGYQVYSEISETWMQLFTYYPYNKKFFKH